MFPENVEVMDIRMIYQTLRTAPTLLNYIDFNHHFRMFISSFPPVLNPALSSVKLARTFLRCRAEDMWRHVQDAGPLPGGRPGRAPIGSPKLIRATSH